MNYFKFLALILFLFSNLDASYLRTIRVGAFHTDKIAQKELTKLKVFVKSHKRIVELQDEWGFDVISRKSGKYYITILEPMTDKKALQEVIDILRRQYPDAYVTKLKSIKPKEKPIVEVTIEDVIEVIPVEVIEEDTTEAILAEEEIEQEDVEQEEAPVVVIEEKLPVEEVLIEKVEVIKEVIPPTVVKQDAPLKKESNAWKFLFILVLFLFIVVSILLFVSKRENKKESKRAKELKEKNDEKDVKHLSQIKNNEHFLSQTQASMSSVVKYSNLLLEFDLSVIQKDYVKRIKNSSEGLLNVVNNTSDISKLQVGKLRITNNDFNIRNMINDVHNIISLDAKQNNVGLSIDIKDEIPSHIVGDEIHLKQVLISLLTNSVKYTKDGDITFTLKKVYSYSHAITLSFIVTDTGVGMSPEQIDSIIYADRNNNATNLSVSKQLVEMMNGDMKIYSTLDVGTTFTFNIKFDLKQ